MSHISCISIKNYRGIEELTQDFGDQKFIVLIGRGDSGKSTILSAINAVLSPSWNFSFSDLDFYKQNTDIPIEIEATIKELPQDLLKDGKFGLFFQNELKDSADYKEICIIIKLTVDKTLEPHWTVLARRGSDIENKPISANDRALLAVNYITDYTDNQFAYNRQSPLYALTKAKLEDGNTVERVKSQLIRSMSEAINPEQLALLDGPLKELKMTAEKLGLNLSNLCAQIDIKENPYTGNSIALHNDYLPFRLQGKGSKRLMSIAIQSELTKQGGIVMIDELEQGLEPDRIITLVRILRDTSNGQVFITSHSLNVVLESSWNNLFIVNKGATSLYAVSQELDSCRRKNPQAFFGKKIVCCEGKTEVGFMRAIDSWIQEKFKTSLSSKGVVIINAEGGNKMFTFSQELKALRYDTCIFADNDNPTELKKYKEQAEIQGIKLFLCDKGNCLERQLMYDLPWKHVEKIINCTQVDFPAKNISLSDELKDRIAKASDDKSQFQIRSEIADLSIKKHHEWFKHIPGGEFLGKVFCEAYDSMNSGQKMRTNIDLFLKWCEIDK